MRLLYITLLMLAIGAVSAQTPPSQVPPPSDVAAPPADATKTPSGLVTKVLKPGTGKDHAAKDDVVTVDYTGWTADGNMFDSSVVRGKPITEPVNRLIPGFSEGVQLMSPGETAGYGFPSRSSTKASQGNRLGCWCST